MKFTYRLYLYWVSIFLVFYIGILSIIFLFWGIFINLWQILLVFFIVGMIPPVIITAYFSKRLNFMESDDINPPKFSGLEKAVLNYKGRSNSPFDEILQRIDRQWIVSYSDRKNCVVKFRTDARVTSWGLGGYIKMEEDEKVLVIVYPLNPKSSRERILVKKILDINRTILNPRA